MSSVQHPQWARSRYPLQAHRQLANKSLTTGTEQHPQQRMLENERSTEHVTPWNRAVTADRLKRYSTTSQAASEEGLPSSPTTEEFAEGSSTAVSLSQRALSPAKSVSNENDHVIPWVQLSTAVQNGDTHAYRSPVFEPYPERDNTGTSTNERPLSPTSDEEEEVAKPELQPRRSLRRMPRSKRIERMKGELSSESLESNSLQQTQDSPKQKVAPVVETSSKESSLASRSSSWKRGTYPLQAVSLGSSNQNHSQVENESHGGDQAHAGKPNGYITNSHPDTRHAEEHSRLSQPAPEHPQSLPASPPESESETESIVPAQTQHHLQNRSASQPRARRRGYPLQAPASRADLQQNFPTPPSSPERESTQAREKQDTHAAGVNVVASSRASSRSRYPLQPPQPASSAHQQQMEHKADTSLRVPQQINQPSPDRLPRSAHQPTTQRTRKGYPLQSPASTTHLDLQPSNQPVEQASEPAQEDERKPAPQVPKSGPKPVRKGYPLQSPASIVNLRPGSIADSQSDNAGLRGKPRTSIPTAHRKGHSLQLAATVADLNTPVPKHLLEEQPAPIEDEEQCVVQKPFRRSGYPLQAAAAPPTRRPTLQSALSTSGSNAIVMRATSRLNDHNNSLENAKKMPHAQIYPLQNNPSEPALPEVSMSDEITFHVSSPGELSPRSVSHEPDTTESKGPAHILLQPEPVRPSLTTPSAREQELAAKVVKQWRRQTYPLQSPDGVHHIPFFTRAPTPQPPGMDTGTTKHHKGPIHLPKNIPAVKDSENRSQGRTIVVCLDGTGDKFDDDNSNIVHLISALKKDDPRQVSYYQAGIGTYAQNGLSSGFEAALDMAVGAGLGLHVRDAYHFLMHSYKEGDKICIFGFSRGAYTARCLAGMIHKVGLLPPRNIQQIPFAYEFYKSDTPEGWRQSEDFKRTFSIDVSVHFLGCFDSVASVGFIPRQLPLSSTPTNKARYFRHAMALDERRAKFKICRHTTKSWEEIEKPNNPADAIAHGAEVKLQHFLPNHKSQDDHPPGHEKNGYDPHAKFGKKHHPNVTDEEYEELAHNYDEYDTDVVEVWFTGCHSDVGGGAVANTERHKLAQIPLRWMIRQAFECDTGIIFKTKVLAEFGLDVHTLWPKYEKLPIPSHGPPPSFLEKYDEKLPPKSIRKNKLVPINKKENGEEFYHLKSHADEDWTPEQVEDYYDAMCDINDMLEKAPNWWILEFYPVQYKIPVAPGEVLIRTGMNLGRYRGVEDVRPKVHWTVLHRMQQKGYKIPVRTAKHVSWEIVV